jgi:hypothetical protein
MPRIRPTEKEEIYAWTAYNYARHSKTDGDDELKKRLNRATLASAKID